MILVDTDVLLDVFEDDEEWYAWSQDQLDSAIATDKLAINPVIYSELSIGFARIEELEATIMDAPLACEEIPREALFLAGRAFVRYRRSSGAKRSVLPDFYIHRCARLCDAMDAADAQRRPLSHLFPDGISHRAVVRPPALARIPLQGTTFQLQKQRK